MKSIHIVNATERDLFAAQSIKPELTEQTFLERLAKQEKGELEYLIVKEESEPVAFVLLKWVGKPTHLDYPDLEDLYTKTSARGKGYASLLMKECEHRAKEKGFTKIGMAANVDPDCAARRLYAKLGYIPDGKEPYVDGVYNGVEDWVIDLEKGL